LQLIKKKKIKVNKINYNNKIKYPCSFHISGAMYKGVPTILSVDVFNSGVSVIFEIPKSPK
jgi:hypothetical protein